MQFDKTITITQWNNEPIKLNDKFLTLGETISRMLANQDIERQFDPYKTFSIISKIQEKEKDIDIDNSDFDKLLKVVEHDRHFTTNGDWVRGLVIDILKKEKSKPTSVKEKSKPN